MSDMKSMGVPITLDVERHLVFNLNVLEKCVDKFKDMNKLLNLNNISEIKWLAVQMLNEDAEIWNEEHPDNPKPILNEKQLGRYVIGVGGLNELQKKVQEALLQGLPAEAVEEVEEKAKEIEKNLIAAQRKMTGTIHQP